MVGRSHPNKSIRARWETENVVAQFFKTIDCLVTEWYCVLQTMVKLRKDSAFRNVSICDNVLYQLFGEGEIPGAGSAQRPKFGA